MKAFILAMAILMGGGSAMAQEVVTPVQECEIIIDYKQEIEVGELAVIDVSGSTAVNVVWERIPTTPDFRLFNDGKIAVFSARTPGDYMFIIAGAKEDFPSVKIITITVLGADTPITPAAFEIKVANWCDLVTSSTKRDDVLKLAQSFYSVASVMETTLQPSIDELIRATYESNQEALAERLGDWLPFREALKSELKNRAEAGSLPDTVSHIRFWKEVASALRKYAETLE